MFGSEFWFQALERDGRHCLFSGKLDLASVEADLVEYDDSGFTVTEVTHIFAPSTNHCLRGENKVFSLFK